MKMEDSMCGERNGYKMMIITITKDIDGYIYSSFNLCFAANHYQS